MVCLAALLVTMRLYTEGRKEFESIGRLYKLEE